MQIMRSDEPLRSCHNHFYGVFNGIRLDTYLPGQHSNIWMLGSLKILRFTSDDLAQSHFFTPKLLFSRSYLFPFNGPKRRTEYRLLVISQYTKPANHWRDCITLKQPSEVCQPLHFMIAGLKYYGLSSSYTSVGMKKQVGHQSG